MTIRTNFSPWAKAATASAFAKTPDGDGRADRFTVFAREVEHSHHHRVLSRRGDRANGTETIYLKDTNGDDKADLKKTLVTGWNMRDTHGEVSNFHYGLDNWYWAMQGYNDSQPVLTNGKPGPRFRQGFLSLQVEGENENVAVTEIEFLRSRTTTPGAWGSARKESFLARPPTATPASTCRFPTAITRPSAAGAARFLTGHRR